MFDDWVGRSNLSYFLTIGTHGTMESLLKLLRISDGVKTDGLPRDKIRGSGVKEPWQYHSLIVTKFFQEVDK